MVGTRLSHYLIEEEIGQGGMGVVYKAQDTRLFRSVAVKILPPHLVSDERNRRRFVQEARAASALNHPNICTVHDIGESDGVHFIVMELVEGKTLRQILEGRGKLPEQEVIEIGVKVCEALAAAHEKGIIHRDIKPDNIMRTEQGLVKVMDFGLAKLAADELTFSSDSSSQFTEQPVSVHTTFSSLQGTASYMSPEQILKESIDHRSDVFSLGVLLYELAIGRNPFQGESNVDIMKSILRERVESVDNERPISKRTAAAIRKALGKEPKERFQDARCFAEALQRPVVTYPIRRAKSARAFTLRLIIPVLSMMLAFFVFSPRSNERGIVPFTNNSRTMPVTSWPGEEDAPSFSPNGNQIAFSADRAGNMDIWMKDLKTGEFTNLTGNNLYKDRFPRWSPKGDMILYDSERDGGGLYVLELASLKSSLIADNGSEGEWAPDGQSIAYRGSNHELQIISLEDRHPQSFFQPKDEGYVYRPTWSHDQKWLLFARGFQTSHKIFAKAIRDATMHPIIEDVHFNTYPVWHEGNQGIYYRSDRGGVRDVWFQKVVMETMRPEGNPIQITNGANIENLDISKDGRRLAYSRIEKRANIQAVRLDRTDKRGPAELRSITQLNRWSADPDVSPDGSKVVFTSPIYDKRDLFICDSNGENLRLLHSSPTSTDYPAWSPDGSKVAFTDGDGPEMELWVLTTETGSKSRLTNNAHADALPDWSPDGKWIVFSRKNPEDDLWVIPATGGPERKLTNHSANDAAPRFSPDGKMIAFVSDRDNYPNVWTIPFEGGKPKQITFDRELGGTGVFWSPDGEFLHYCPMLNGVRNIWKISLDGSHREQITFFTGSTNHVARMTRLSIFNNELFFANFERVGDIWLIESQPSLNDENL